MTELSENAILFGTEEFIFSGKFNFNSVSLRAVSATEMEDYHHRYLDLPPETGTWNLVDTSFLNS